MDVIKQHPKPGQGLNAVMHVLLLSRKNKILDSQAFLRTTDLSDAGSVVQQLAHAVASYSLFLVSYHSPISATDTAAYSNERKSNNIK